MPEDCLERVSAEIVACEQCLRLRDWCRSVAVKRRPKYQNEEYWGRPVPGFGDPAARLLILGLAPGAHGANRTGRVFTGDEAGVWLYEALHRHGFASAPASVARPDGLRLTDTYITNMVRCAPPGNHPDAAERRACAAFLSRELRLLGGVKVVLTLGQMAFDQYLAWLRDEGTDPGRLVFGHGRVYDFPGTGKPTLIASYHTSAQNTRTGTLTPAMFAEVFSRIQELLAASAPSVR